MDGTATTSEQTRLDLEPLTGRIGAVVHGLDLRQHLHDVESIEDALARHKVLFFRDQHLDPLTHVAFARGFGDLTRGHPTVPSVAGHEHVFELDAAQGARANVWHTDVTFVHRPPRASILNAVVIPPVGGDTLWADTDAAYLDLPEHLRLFAERAWAVHANTSDYGAKTTAGDSYTAAFASQRFEARHPLVRVHPRTGRPSLLLGGFVRRVDGLAAQESADLVRLLQAHVTKPEHTVRWRWRAGDVAMWDNRATQHYAIDDFGDQPRRVQRVTLMGEAARSIDGRESEAVTGDAAAYLGVTEC